jgi:two-component system chemotaxis response regulator CheY
MADALRLLIVDDSKIALAQLGSIIDAIEGAEVADTAEDGLGAIRCASATRPDLILMDIVMPHMDGLAALRMLRAQNPEARVVMLSSLGGSGTYAEEAFRLGAVQVISKPFDTDQIESLIESELKLRSKAT